MLDLPLDAERALLGRFFGQSYLSASVIGFILVGLLMFAAFTLRYYLRTLAGAASGGTSRHDSERTPQRAARAPQSAALASRAVLDGVRGGSGESAGLRGGRRLRAGRAAESVVQQALARNRNGVGRRGAAARSADTLALRRPLVVVSGNAFGFGVRHPHDRLLRQCERAQIAGRSVRDRRGCAFAQ